MPLINYLTHKPDTNDSLNILTQKIADQHAIARGEYGSDYVSGTGANTGQMWGAFLCVTAATFSVLTGNAAGLTGVAIPAGTTFYGMFSAFTLTSGSVLAYRAA